MIPKKNNPFRSHCNRAIRKNKVCVRLCQTFLCVVSWFIFSVRTTKSACTYRAVVEVSRKAYVLSPTVRCVMLVGRPLWKLAGSPHALLFQVLLSSKRSTHWDSQPYGAAVVPRMSSECRSVAVLIPANELLRLSSVYVTAGRVLQWHMPCVVHHTLSHVAHGQKRPGNTRHATVATTRWAIK